MVNIVRALKVKIGDFSEENLQKANAKCLEAREYLSRAGDSDTPEYDILKAAEIYIEAIDIYSRLTEPYIAIAEICYQFDKYEESIALLNKLLDIDPFFIKAINMLNKITKEYENINATQHKTLSNKVAPHQPKKLHSLTKIKEKSDEAVLIKFNMSEKLK